jgi:GH25 family lysozyme M1 (1,4-beta-N-acetylmuramidase)
LAGGASILGSASAVAAPQGQLMGVDASHYNGTPSWLDAMNDGVQFEFAKATEGQSLTDAQYARNRRRADALGLPFGAYHFARPDNSPNDAVLEADHFVDAAGLRGRHLLPVLDLEDAGTLGPRRLRDWTKAWLARVDSRIGVKAIIYTTPSFWTDRMGNSTWFASHGYRLWIAHWGVDSPTVPAGNWGGHGWTFWQYDNCGSVQGIDGCVDVDHYNGNDLNPQLIANNR